MIAQAQDVALVGGRLIDGHGGAPLEDATVLIRGREFLGVGSRANVPVPDGARIYDVHGKTLLPGLIDGHVHLRSYAGADRSDFYLWREATFLEEQVLHAAANARRALEAGFTTLRDCAGGRLEVAVKHATDQQLLDGARVV